MTKSEFWKNAVPKNVKGQVVTAAVFAYISAAMTLVLGFLTGNFLVLIDVLLVLGLGLGVHLAKSRVCAIILAAYFVLNKVLQWLGGEFSGLYMAVIFIIGFVMGVVGTFAFQKQWKEYQAGCPYWCEGAKGQKMGSARLVYAKGNGLSKGKSKVYIEP